MRIHKFWQRAKYLLLILFCSTQGFAYPLPAAGQKLTTFLDDLDVTNRWLPNRYVEWRTGVAVGPYQGIRGTHCSTFVAAAATRLGIYLPRPPEHQQLLANAQYHWLRQKGSEHGWAPVDTHQLAQHIANQGCFVVVAYGNPNQNRSGHIAIVRPSTKSKMEINSKGPQIIQAGRQNYNSTTLSKAFRQHHLAFKRKKIVYYAHSTPFCQLLAKRG